MQSRRSRALHIWTVIFKMCATKSHITSEIRNCQVYGKQRLLISRHRPCKVCKQSLKRLGYRGVESRSDCNEGDLKVKPFNFMQQTENPPFLLVVLCKYMNFLCNKRKGEWNKISILCSSVKADYPPVSKPQNHTSCWGIQSTWKHIPAPATLISSHDPHLVMEHDELTQGWTVGPHDGVIGTY